MPNLRTKNIITRFEEVDEAWAFQFYLNLKEKLEGQEVETFTPLKRVNGEIVEERTPSFFVFYNSRYFFKCYSTGSSGDIYEMVRLKFGYKTKAEAVDRVWYDYENYLNANNLEYTLHDSNNTGYKEHKRFSVEGYDLRKWNQHDQQFWSKYFIGTSLLTEYFVSPIQTVHLKKVENGETFRAKLERPLLYGYFKKDGELYKVYQPGNSVKYLKVSSYIQGTEQLSLTNENLLITKSLKDIMGFRALQIPNWDVVAPESENALLPAENIAIYKKRYKKIVSLFDNDDAGRNAESLYKEIYGIEGVGFNMGQKDLTDSLEKNQYELVKIKLTKLLT